MIVWWYSLWQISNTSKWPLLARTTPAIWKGYEFRPPFCYTRNQYINILYKNQIYCTIEHNIGRLGGWSGVWVYILFCWAPVGPLLHAIGFPLAHFWMPRAPFGVPCQCLGPALGLAGARKGKVTPSGGGPSRFWWYTQHFGAKMNPEPDEPDEADEAETVAATAAQSPPSTRAGGQDDGS